MIEGVFIGRFLSSSFPLGSPPCRWPPKERNRLCAQPFVNGRGEGWVQAADMQAVRGRVKANIAETISLARSSAVPGMMSWIMPLSLILQSGS